MQMFHVRYDVKFRNVCQGGKARFLERTVLFYLGLTKTAEHHSDWKHSAVQMELDRRFVVGQQPAVDQVVHVVVEDPNAPVVVVSKVAVVELQLRLDVVLEEQPAIAVDLPPLVAVAVVVGVGQASHSLAVADQWKLEQLLVELL